MIYDELKLELSTVCTEQKEKIIELKGSERRQRSSKDDERTQN